MAGSTANVIHQVSTADGEGPAKLLLSAVIVNYYRWPDVAALVQNLNGEGALASTMEVVVVDNRSPRHPLRRQLRQQAGVALRCWRRNPGFAAAVNEGLRLSLGRWLLILNPDIQVSAQFAAQVQALAAHLDQAAPRAGIVGFRLRHGDGSAQLSCGRFPTLVRTVLGLLRPRSIRKYVALATDRRQRVDWVTGCCLLVRRECLAEIGGLDETFFLYYEDVDLCRRAQAAGWTVWYEPRLTAIHHRPLHSRPLSPLFRFLTRHGLLTYAHKHWPGWQARALGWLVRLEAWWRRFRARKRGHGRAALLAGETAALAAEVMRRESGAALRRLSRVVRRFARDLRPLAEDAARETIRHHPQPQPAGPAASLPAERVPLRPR